MTFTEVLTVAQIGTPVAMLVIGFLGRNALGRFTDQIKALQISQAKTAADLTEHVRDQTVNCDRHMAENAAAYGDVVESKVDREDWIRECARSRQTQEKLVEGLARIEGRLGISVRVMPAGEEHG
jgi:hypothetical protein